MGARIDSCKRVRIFVRDNPRYVLWVIDIEGVVFVAMIYCVLTYLRAGGAQKTIECELCHQRLQSEKVS